MSYSKSQNLYQVSDHFHEEKKILKFLCQKCSESIRRLRKHDRNASFVCSGSISTGLQWQCVKWQLEFWTSALKESSFAPDHISLRLSVCVNRVTSAPRTSVSGKRMWTEFDLRVVFPSDGSQRAKERVVMSVFRESVRWSCDASRLSVS